MIGKEINAEVIGVYPNKVKISVDNLNDFKAGESLKVGSYIRIPSDDGETILISVIESFSIEVSTEGKRKHLIDANPLGIIKDGKFIRGGDSIALPPKEAEPASTREINDIYQSSVELTKRLEFSSLSTNSAIRIPLDGNKFFNKHIAVVGSTGSGKSHTVTKIIQTAVNGKSGDYSLNNSHVVIFDIHSEYRSAFSDANFIDVSNLVLPYWLLTSEELEELFLDSDSNDHNQKFIFRESVVENRKLNAKCSDVDKVKIHFDSPLFFDLNNVLNSAKSKNEEVIDTGEVYASGAKKGLAKTVQGSLYGKLTNFVNRLEHKINDSRLDFLLGERSKKISFEDTIRNLLSYQEDKKSNVTIIDLSGVPFEVLSITVSLISRLMFEYGYYYNKIRCDSNPNEKINNDTPVLLVYEEAHKYVPNSDLVKYRASKRSIERIAKEGRKYGVTLLLASQRPSEISETIFSQCNNFVAMRLTNPSDQAYVKRLLPDSLGSLIDTMPSLRAGEALLIGESIVLPSIVQIDPCDENSQPSSSDIPYWELWKDEWKTFDIDKIKSEWFK